MTLGMVSCMLLCWRVVFAGLVILASSPYSSELLVPGGGCGWGLVGVRHFQATDSFAIDLLHVGTHDKCLNSSAKYTRSDMYHLLTRRQNHAEKNASIMSHQYSEDETKFSLSERNWN